MNQYLINKLLYYNIINENEVEEYTYAILVLKLKFFHYSIFLLLGVVFNEIIEFLTFVFTYALTRQFLGGFHAKKSSVCFLLSVLFSFGLHIILKIITLRMSLSLILIMFFVLIIFLIDKKHKKKLILYLIFIDILSIFFFYYNCDSLLLSILYGLSLTILLKYVGLKS